MNSQTMPLSEPVVAAPVETEPRNGGSGVARLLVGLWKFLFGVVCTQTFATSFLAAGWVLRAARREVVRSWWRASPFAKTEDFAAFARRTSFHQGEDRWPNWFIAWSPGAAQATHLKTLPRRLLLSFWLNLKAGAQIVFNTCLLTLPGCALMLFAWYAGWHNSFNKGYEQAAVGPITGFAGIFLFIAVMFYVPLAQMRQASTGDWRVFYQFKTTWLLIRKRWLLCCGLALLFSAFSVPVTILKTAPQFFPQINPALAELSPLEALRFARRYYFFGGFIFFAAYLSLRILAARVYASALLACIHSGALPEDALAEREWEALHRLNLLTTTSNRSRHFLVRTVTWCGTKLGKATVALVLFVAWFSFVSQIYVSEFLMKTELGRGWLNQPLVQLPWFNYIPSHLRKAGSADGATTEPPPAWGGRQF